MSASDARTRYTRNMVESCFLQILGHKPLAKITVTEICQAAGINRATFYKHYLDVPDLLEQMEQDLLAKLRDALGSINESGQISSESLLQAIERTLEFIRQGAGTYMILASDSGDPTLPMKTFNTINGLFYPVLEQRFTMLEKPKREMLYNYLTLGCGGVLMTWIRQGMREDSHEMAAFLLKLSVGATSGVNS